MSIMDEIKKDIEKTYEYKCGYHQSRVDLLMPYDVESIEELIENVQKKARADAIDEFVRNMKRRYPIEYNDCGMIINEGIHNNLDYIAEQLKEQKNE